MTTFLAEHDTEMEAAIRESAHDILRAVSPVTRLRELRDSDPGYERSVWDKIAEAGWTGVLVDQDFGGMGLGLRAACAIATEVGRNPLPEPYMAGAWHASAILNGLPQSALRDELLSNVASGSAIIGVAWQGTEKAGRVTSKEEGDGYILSGERHWVYPARADGWLVISDDHAIHWVPSDTANVVATAHPRVDGSLAATLRLENTRIARSHRLANGSAAQAAVAHAQALLRVLQAAELLGIAQEAFDTTLAYLKTRVQFGKPIGANQALQHRMVDAYLQLRLAQAVLEEFLSTYDMEAPDDIALFAAECARAKARCAHAAQHITRLAIQFHGAIGYTDELDVGLYLKRMLHLTSWLGGIRENRRLAGRDQIAESATETRVAYDAYPVDTDWNSLPEAEFRAVVRDFMARNYPSKYRHSSQRLHWHEIKDWYFALSKQGWIAPAWPREHGGMGLSPAKLIAFIEEMEAYGVARTPDQGIINIGPVLIRHGNDEQRNKFLPKILTGEHVWCQGYSEPNAGSDLASLRTEAVLDGDEFVVNGQKIWTTLAQDATHIFLLVRTDKTVKKQAGISFLLADMRTPGITVRPIRNIGGEEEFCEVFFDNVRVPKENLVGNLNEGWTIAKALLDFERLFVGSPSQAQYALNQLRAIGEQRGLFEDSAFHDRYIDAMLDVLDLQSLYGEYADIVKRGERLPASVSLLKIWATETYSRLCMESVEAAGDQGGDDVAFEAGDMSIHPTRRLFNSSITTIYGGSNEIQRNILAKVVLELPTSA
jgi:alkylation response protein AidB-like acyl-CoA dehydrogenase